MRYFFIILILLGFTGTLLINNYAYGLWIPQSPDELLTQSQTIFVGNITSVKALEFAKSSTYQTEDNGVERQVIENYTLVLDEYTVSVEEFLKNPQDSDMMVVRQPTTSIPGKIVPVGGFEAGDRVLFYLEKIDGENTYSPESFEIPEPCDAKSVLSKPRIIFGHDMRTIQNGIQMIGNFTAGMPIQFVYDIDTRTLEGKSYDFDIGINKVVDNKAEPVFREKIHAESKLCEWIATAKWEITPQAGKYSRAFSIYEEGGDSSSLSGQFFVKADTSLETSTPINQFKFGIPLTEIKCKENLTLLKKTSNGLPICVSIKTGQKLLERKWAQTMAFTAPLESTQKSDSKNTNEPYTTIEISFGNLTKSKLLPVVFSEITHNAEYMNEILVWNFELIGHNADDRRKTWDTTPEDQRISYKITDEYGTNVIDNTRMPDNYGIPADLHLYSMDCGLFQTVDGESAHPTVFAVNKGTSTIIAKNSNKGILPISDGKYSFEFASMFETAVNLPKNAQIILQESKQCKLVQGVEGDPYRTYVDGYYTKMVFSLEN